MNHTHYFKKINRLAYPFQTGTNFDPNLAVPYSYLECNCGKVVNYD